MSKRVQSGREEYGEIKERVNISLTPTAMRLLDERGLALGVSRSELIERFARGLISPEAQILGEFCAN